MVGGDFWCDLANGLTLNYLGEKWFNIKLPGRDSLTLNDRSLRAPRVNWTLGINLSDYVPGVLRGLAPMFEIPSFVALC